MIVAGQLYILPFGEFLEWNQLPYPAMAPVIICTIGMFFAPESPISLVEKGQTDKALQALKLLRKPESDIDDELNLLKERVETSKNVPSGLSWSMLKRRDVYNPAIIAIALMVSQQFSGINGMMFNLVTIFKKANVPFDSLAATILVTFFLVAATVVGAFLMDILGRKMLLIISASGNMASVAFMGVYYLWISPEQTWIPVACLIVFVSFISVGFGPIPWMIVAEITPNEALETIGAIATSSNWLSAFIITKEFVQLTNLIKDYGAYFLFAGFSFLSLVYTIIFVPETKHRSIEDMQRYFLNK